MLGVIWLRARCKHRMPNNCSVSLFALVEIFLPRSCIEQIKQTHHYNVFCSLAERALHERETGIRKRARTLSSAVPEMGMGTMQSAPWTRFGQACAQVWLKILSLTLIVQSDSSSSKDEPLLGVLDDSH